MDGSRGPQGQVVVVTTGKWTCQVVPKAGCLQTQVVSLKESSCIRFTLCSATCRGWDYNDAGMSLLDHYLLHIPCCQESRPSSNLLEGPAKRIYCLPSHPEFRDGLIKHNGTSPRAVCSSAAEAQHAFESSQISSQHLTRLYKPSCKAGRKRGSEAGHHKLAQQPL